MREETHKQYIQRMTGTKGKIFTPDGWISVHNYKYRNKRMLFIECYTGCIYKAGQPIAKFWMNPTDSIHLAHRLLEESQIWNTNKKKKPNENPSTSK